MLVHSAGILPYRYVNGQLEVMISHPGGPFWEKKDTAAWSIPKGIVEENESVLEAAIREFHEETGIQIDTDLIELGTKKQSSQKIITIFATNKDIDTSKVVSNMFEMEWPPKSGIMKSFPENDRSQWFSIEIAKIKVFKGQIWFLDKLISELNYEEPKQLSLFD